jgi:NAD(P)-dependent dehydrogenase (short-subunit alcohol dehydrogenase family)
MNDKVWLITGCSTGFGRELAQRTLELGYSTVITALQSEEVNDLIAGREDQALALELDVTKPAEVMTAVRAAHKRFGRIDVLVNNAGIGYLRSFEGSDIADVKRLFDVNLWGLVSMTRAVLPGMRALKSGTIVNIGSLSGLVAIPALSFYCASKFAVEGISEALAKEVMPLGLRVIVVEPGASRTKWALSSDNEFAEDIPDYDATAGEVRRATRRNNGKQPGDPARAAAAIVQAVESPNPPSRLLLGREALEGARKKISLLKEQFDEWEALSLSADFPATEKQV